MDLQFIGKRIAVKRRQLGLTQVDLALRAAVSRATVEALENGRSSELGFSKIIRILSALGMELELREQTGRRPTLDQLIEAKEEEDRNAQGMDRRR